MKKLLHWINILWNTYCSTSYSLSSSYILIFPAWLDWLAVKYCLTPGILSLDMLVCFIQILCQSPAAQSPTTLWNQANIYELTDFNMELDWPDLIVASHSLEIRALEKISLLALLADIRVFITWWLCHHLSYFHGQSGIIPLTGDIWGLEGEGEERKSAGDQFKITFLKYIWCHLNSNVL